jgi:hypothetical protein
MTAAPALVPPMAAPASRRARRAARSGLSTPSVRRSRRVMAFWSPPVIQMPSAAWAASTTGRSKAPFFQPGRASDTASTSIASSLTPASRSCLRTRSMLRSGSAVAAGNMAKRLSGPPAAPTKREMMALSCASSAPPAMIRDPLCIAYSGIIGYKWLIGANMPLIAILMPDS